MADLTDKITDTRNNGRPTSATVVNSRNVNDAYLDCSALTGWPTASKVHFITYKIDTNLVQIPNTQMDIEGIVSGNSITQLRVKDGPGGVDIGNAVGDIVEMLPTAAWGQDLSDALMKEHKRDGSHENITADSVNVTGTVAVTGNITLNGKSLAAIMYPVGTIYTEVTGTNPNSTFGFGTWTAFGTGRVLVGVNTGDTDFNTVEKTGGASTVTLTSAQSGLKTHTHTGATYGAGAHTHGLSALKIRSNANTYSTGYNPVMWDGNFPATSNTTDGVGDHAHNVDVYGQTASDAASAHTNLQPYITVYMWKRVA